MFFIKIKRVTKAGFLNFWRNGWVSLTAILIMVITLFTIGSLLFSHVVLGTTLGQIQDKVDISIYFKGSVSESDILALKESVAVLPEVKAVEYVPAEQALEDFKKRHEDNALIIQSIEELSENPLGAIVNIKAKEISQYPGIASFLDSETSSVKGVDSIIDKVNYFQNKDTIESLSRILSSTKKLGFSLTFVLIIISVLVIFNTIGLVIYNSRNEIEVMKLVGASNKFASGPFIVEGMMYGVSAAIITMILFYPATIWIGDATENFFGGVNIYEYYIANFGQIFVLLLFVGVALGAISSYIATRRYLKI